MKSPGIFARLLLLILLFGLLSSRTQAQTNAAGPQNCKAQIDPNTCKVTISSCRVDSNGEPFVGLQDVVTWSPDTYTVTFKKTSIGLQHTPFPDETFSSARGEVVQGDWLCRNFRTCYYSYSLTRQGESNTCIDPGVRVVPPNSILVYLWVGALGALVVLTGVVFWRLRARNRESSAS